MKLLLIPALLLGAGLGGYRLADTDASESPSTALEDCRVTVECTPRGTCLITCYEENGDVRCQKEIECDEPCERACDRPCEAQSSCAK
jgi:hypothetical protein